MSNPLPSSPTSEGREEASLRDRFKYELWSDGITKGGIQNQHGRFICEVRDVYDRHLVRSAPDLLRENTELRASLTEAQAREAGLRSAFSQFAEALQSFEINAETQWRDWGHARYAVLAAVSTLRTTALKYGAGADPYSNVTAKRKVKELEHALTEAQAENKRLKAAIRWALGEVGEFEPTESDKRPGPFGLFIPKFWWRTHLERKAFVDGAQ